MNIGFIGFGNMAQAMADGLLLKKAVEPRQIFVCAKNWEKLKENARSRGAVPCRTAAEVAEHAELVVVAVKPYLVAEVLAPVGELLRGKTLVCVAAGISYEKLEEILPEGIHHLTIMPNTPVSVGEGVILCEERHSLTETEFSAFRELFSRIGLIETLPASQFGIAGDLTGCGPAFTAMYLEALADGAVAYGLPRALAYRLASQMVVGTGKLQLETGVHPGAMKDAVCSPGGLTIAGVAALEKSGFRAAAAGALEAVQKKRRES